MPEGMVEAKGQKLVGDAKNQDTTRGPAEFNYDWDGRIVHSEANGLIFLVFWFIMLWSDVFGM